jgi:hypothetical protein
LEYQAEKSLAALFYLLHFKVRYSRDNKEKYLPCKDIILIKYTEKTQF